MCVCVKDMLKTKATGLHFIRFSLQSLISEFIAIMLSDYRLTYKQIYGLMDTVVLKEMFCSKLVVINNSEDFS